MKKSIIKQIEVVKAFVAANPNGVIAKNIDEARTAGTDGKRMLLLSLERVDGVLESDSDIKRSLSRKEDRGIVGLVPAQASQLNVMADKLQPENVYYSPSNSTR